MTSVLRGNRSASAHFSRRVAPIIRARVRTGLVRLTDPSRRANLGVDLDDLTQEVYLRLFACNGRALRAWDASRGRSLLSFVRLIADREVSNVLLSLRRSPSDPRFDLAGDMREAPVAAASDEGRVIARDRARKLLGRLHEGLSPRGRDLFRQLIIEERPVGEVARRFGMQVGAVYAWRSRLSRRAREIARGLETEPE